MHRTVVTCSFGADEAINHHEEVTHAAVARMIAELKGCAFAGEFQETAGYAGPLYFVPHKTVVGFDLARRRGIHGPEDLYGGVVPLRCIGTKAIMHGLVGPHAARPDGWCERLVEAVREAVLPGYTVFNAPDACLAASALLRGGCVRVKRCASSGGLGQWRVGGYDELVPIIAALEPDQLAEGGLVLERHLDPIQTYSVGQISIDGLTASYFGTQRLTTNNDGASCYGGTDLVIARGGYDSLLGFDVPEHVRLAIRQAMRFDQALTQHYPTIFASRRNYDVGQGLDGQGTLLSGVLDQSWRIGGASGPEVAALRAFRDDPSVQVVEASVFEAYGGDVQAPEGCLVHFDGVDRDAGPMKIYTVIRGIASPRPANRIPLRLKRTAHGLPDRSTRSRFRSNGTR